MSETAFFFRLGEHRLFGVLHRPDRGAALHGIVLCHALAEEKLWSHRVYVNLARDLAREGHAVLRFDCRGEGDSDLEFEDCSLDTRRTDTLRAAEVLLEHEPHLPGCIFLGHRLGCAAAAMAASRSTARALGVVAWDPITNGRDHLMQLLRAALAREFGRRGEARTRSMLLAALEAGETVQVDGYGIGPQLYRDLVALEWLKLLEAVRCPTFAIEGACEPPFWQPSKRLFSRAPVMSMRTAQWLQKAAT